MLTESDIDDANAFAERLRRGICDLKPHRGNEVIYFTASFGVAERQPDDISIDALIEKSDKALYEAKEQGKDRVINFSSELHQATDVV